MEIDATLAPKLTVDLAEGTVAGPGGSVRLEPKVMEVLAVLARQPGRVVSRDELLDTVWSGLVVTEHTLTRCIYQLRSQLAKIGNTSGATGYDPIETLPKRGYRLLATVEIATDVSATAQRQFSDRPLVPYVVGQWVRGDRFYGRNAQIDEILNGHRNCVWLLGTRRIGKTSLLKQIEHIADTSPGLGYFPVFWDFQGAETAQELHLNFADALLDADERLERIGIDLADVEAQDLFFSLERLRRHLRARKLRLLLLCDEVEELIELHQKEPALLRKLRHAMQSREDIRTVLASTIRLWALADQRDDTSPFLHGFAPPLYVARFSDVEAQSLIEQTHLAPEHRPPLPGNVVTTIRERCDNHPYLIQLVCKRYLETKELGEAIEGVATDRMVSYFFSVDFDMLAPAERQIIQMMVRPPTVRHDRIENELSLQPDVLAGTLRRLANLGYTRSDDDGRFELANFFFRRWLKQIRDRPDPAVTPAPTRNALAAEPESVEERSSAGLFAELNRRHVVRVVISYILVAWVLLQVGEIVFDFLEVPTWAGKMLIVFLALGLPVAFFLAWAFELTPEGVKRDSDVDTSRASRRGRRLDYLIIALLAVAIIYFVADKFL